jgi:ABC-type dipeptide/oligopeptide/nickel transport system permease component
MTRLYNTGELAVLGIILASVVGISLGILSTLKPYSWLDNVSLVVSLAGISMPVFWVGLLLMWLFAVQLGWFPATGRGDWKNLVLPTITTSGPSLALVARVTRASILEVVNKDYVRTAHSKGLTRQGVMIGHVLPNALLSTVTVIGLQLGRLLAGAVLTESVFAWPGLGRLVVEAIKARDYPVVQGSLLLITLMFVLINLLVDLLYGVLDPRVRSGESW